LHHLKLLSSQLENPPPQVGSFDPDRGRRKTPSSAPVVALSPYAVSGKIEGNYAPMMLT